VRNIRMMALVLGLLTMLGGCVTISLKSGSYYLDKREYTQGIEAQRSLLQDDPDDAQANYYTARYYLALEKPEQALPFIKRAVSLEPDDADYLFWLGVNHWALMQYDQERAAYQRAVAVDPDHISANLYLGHGYVDDKNWTRALAQYDTVLRLDPYNPEALYNRAVALGGLGRTDDEEAALKRFLEDYPDGSLAMRAASRLNQLGDFSYRNFIIGGRNVTLRTMEFKKWSGELEPESKESLHVIEAMLNANSKLVLHVVAYKKGDLAGARDMAQRVRDYILEGRKADSRQLRASWFDTPEEIEVEGTSHSLDKSVQFITATTSTKE